MRLDLNQNGPGLERLVCYISCPTKLGLWEDKGNHGAFSSIGIMLNIYQTVAACLVALGIAACATQSQSSLQPFTPAEQVAMVEAGREIATTHCRNCHAIARSDESPRPDAPPLRHVLERYDSSALAGNLMIGVQVGHPEMPKFHMSPNDADALIEYLYSIRTLGQSH